MVFDRLKKLLGEKQPQSAEVEASAIEKPAAEVEASTSEESAAEAEASTNEEPAAEVEPSEYEKALRYCPNFPLGDGYRLSCDLVPDGKGGYRSNGYCLFKENELIKRFTDDRGNFLDFPGVEHGDWEKSLIEPLEPRICYPISYNSFKENGLADFVWMVQPDGRYWADDDGFGAENNPEISLYAKFNKKGEFVTKFEYRE